MVLAAGAGLGLRAAGIDLTQVTPDRIRGFVLSFGALTPLIYLAVYGQPVIPLPASIMTIAGGLVFGPVWGVPAALSGATIRACSQFGVARVLGREAVEKLLHGHLASLNQKISTHGFWTAFWIRLIPNVPFDMQNYGLGFSKIRFAPYALGTFLGMIPGSVAFVYLGYSLTDLRHAWKILVAVLLIAGLAVAQRRLLKKRRLAG